MPSPAVPKPLYLRMLEGNPGHHAKTTEPEPLFRMPMPPDHLSAYALEEWETISEGLFYMRLLSEVDRSTLSSYCMAYATWRIACEKLNELAKIDEEHGGLVVEAPNGTLSRNPMVNVMMESARDMLRYAIEMGCTPAARTRMAIRLTPYSPRSKFGKSLLGGKK